MENELKKNIWDELLKIEKHEDKMLTSMIRLIRTNEKMSERINRLTTIMLILTWVTLIISIPNTLATFYGIQKINEMLKIELILITLMFSLILPMIILFWAGFDLRNIMKNNKTK
ncbi:hypothetical protein A3K80_08600 [Candidatus Bathyarchaeota archaeon RBG_13_38_9]|nr:MAG: hypothetical protein A3K80_08600 [Candidatus Bathyarchaeota archaeon RBG_13_38_9]